MIKRVKKIITMALLCMVVTGTIFSFCTGALAEEMKTKSPSYQTITEIKDWGAVITKVIVNVGKMVPAKSVTTDTFKVHVTRSDNRLADPLLEKGYRKVTSAYVADKKGNPADKRGSHVVLEMEIGPSLSLGSPMHFDEQSFSKDWIHSKYRITQQKDIVTPGGKISGLLIDTYAGGSIDLVDKFSTGKATYDDVTLTYADFKPATDYKKNPLIIWLHGGGEGGTDPTVPLAANKAANFASSHIQSYFDSAYVLVPQTPTYWMDGVTRGGDGTSKYEKPLMNLIQDYLALHKDIDPNRIYIGGNSAGGYMTMNIIRKFPKSFAAAFPTCEALSDRLISNGDIQRMKDIPIWFVAAKTDTAIPVQDFVIPTYNRLINAGAKNVHLSLFDNVVDTSGLYKKEDGTPYEYDGHWSWIYVYNNEVFDGKMTLMEWLNNQSLNHK
ncbi:prolyl oligopeptidase family serine peptidase (plasmid) [Bacillus cereus]|uniref:prolyl oligopeptidase family serine peptidase n=1 Tax=Bacillus cereus TaxID=1396 RepID=UPI001F46402B|nr:prolyl oligopeptidase family serine peptidase [Bacillus cereus]UIJ69892.1 prolyl oligopeptidase family serine peptidase [Bacillus cereus]